MENTSCQATREAVDTSEKSVSVREVNKANSRRVAQEVDLSNGLNGSNSAKFAIIEKIKTDRAKLKTLIHRSNACVLRVDKTATIKQLDAGAVKAIGIDPEEAIGRHITDIFPKDSHDDGDEHGGIAIWIQNALHGEVRYIVSY
jgi:transcriptional regulator with PAS, ATPase and Fis domain